MDLFKQGMKGPIRPAPAVPGVKVNRYSPVTNWNDDPFGDVFEPTPNFNQKKKPPPRPPPPKVQKQPEVPVKPSHFVRKPTVLSSLLSRKSKTTVNQISANDQVFLTDLSSEVDTNKMFPKCERSNVQTGTLIDFTSPPSSPTFTTRSSSDGVSVDSFGSDATTSTNHHNAMSGGNASQAESGFEDDFDLFLHSRKPLSKEDTLDDFGAIDPFSPTLPKPPVSKKPAINKISLESNVANGRYAVLPMKKPTIIRAKPARPKPPDNSALLKSTFGSNFQITSMNINITTPIQKIGNGFLDHVDSNSCSWDQEDLSDREPTPPMPTIPPPPPPAIIDEDLPVDWSDNMDLSPETFDDEEPHAIALFDYFTDHQEDLCFSANTKIKLLRRANEEWVFGRLINGAEGLFPSNYVEIKVPLPNEASISTNIGSAVALYDFEPVQAGDLQFKVGDKITVLSKINDEWYFGECKSLKGQFPVNYVHMS